MSGEVSASPFFNMSHVVLSTFIKNGRRHRRHQPFASDDIHLIRELEQKKLIEPVDIKKKDIRKLFA